MSADPLTALTRLGHEREKVLQAADEIEAEVRDAVRRAYYAGAPKVDIARAAGVSRPTVDKWLEEK